MQAGKRNEPERPRLIPVEPVNAQVVVPGKTTYPSVSAAMRELDRMWSDLEGIGDRVTEQQERARRLQVRLADPELFGHPKRQEAERRYEGLVVAIAEDKARMEATMLVMGDVYLALPGEVRAGMGWAPVTDRYGMRTWVESCLAVGWRPQDEVPF